MATLDQVVEQLQLLGTQVQNQATQLRTLGTANASLTAQLAAANSLPAAEDVQRKFGRVKLSVFSGDNLLVLSARAYLYETQLKFVAAGIDPNAPGTARKVIEHVMANLSGPAQLWARAASGDDPSVLVAETWKELKTALLARFCPHDEEEAGYEAFERVVEKGQAKLGIAGYNREMLTARLHCPDMSDREFMHAYRRGLTDPNRALLAKELALHGPRTQAQVLGMFERVDGVVPSRNLSSNMGPPANRSEPTPMEVELNMLREWYGNHTNGAHSDRNWGERGDYQHLNAVYRQPHARPDNRGQPQHRNNFFPSDRNTATSAMHQAHRDSDVVMQPALPRLDFSALPPEFQGPYVNGGRDMREKCIKAGRCTYCRQLLASGHAQGCTKKNAEVPH